MQTVPLIMFSRVEREILAEALRGVEAVAQVFGKDADENVRVIGGIARSKNDPITRARLDRARNIMQAARDQLARERTREWWEALLPGGDESHLPEPMRPSYMCGVLAEARERMYADVVRAINLLALAADTIPHPQFERIEDGA